MVTEDLVELWRCRGPGLDPVGTALVQVGAKALRHRVVRRVAYEDVGEDEAVLAGECARVGADQPFPDEPLERAGDLSLLLGRRQVGYGAPPEHLADHGGTLQDRALERLEPVEPRGEHGLDGLGNADRLDVRQRLQPSVALHERAFLDEHAQHLLEEERVAAGCAADGVGGVLVERAREILEQLPRVVALQRRQLDRRRSGPCRPQLREIAAGETADENRRVASPAREVLDQIEKRRLRPLDVVENEQHGPLTRKRLEQPPEGPVELVAARVWLGATDGLEEPAVHGLAVGLPDEDRIEVEPADDLDERPVGDPVPVGQAAALEDVSVLAQRRDQFGSKARLADARVAEDGDDAAGPLQHDLVDGRAKARELDDTADQRRVDPPRHTGGAGKHVV